MEKTVSEQWRYQVLVAFSACYCSRTKHRSDAWPSWIDAHRQYILL